MTLPQHFIEENYESKPLHKDESVDMSQWHSSLPKNTRIKLAGSAIHEYSDGIEALRKINKIIPSRAFCASYYFNSGFFVHY
jgi:hypothetical protein